MNPDYPHDIKPISELTVEQIGKFIPLTPEQVALLEPMTPAERGQWLQEQNERKLRETLGGLEQVMKRKP